MSVIFTRYQPYLLEKGKNVSETSKASPLARGRHGGYRPGSGRKPRNLVDGVEDEYFPPLPGPSRFVVDGMAEIPGAEDDPEGLRELRDTVIPILRKLGLVPRTIVEVRGQWRKRKPFKHHRTVNAVQICQEVFAFPMQTLDQLAIKLYRPMQRKGTELVPLGEWGSADQAAAVSRLRVALVKLYQFRIISRQYDTATGKPVLVTGPEYERYMKEHSAL